MNATTNNNAAIIVTTCTRDQIDPRTEEVRATDYRVSNSLSTTQCWKWDGGDALVVVGARPAWDGSFPNFVVIRRGAEVQVLETKGILSAFRWLAMNVDIQW